MAFVRFDTHKAVKALTEVGFSEPQAESVVSTVSDAIGGELATKADLKELELRLTLRFGGMTIAAVGIMIAAMTFLEMTFLE